MISAHDLNGRGLGGVHGPDARTRERRVGARGARPEPASPASFEAFFRDEHERLQRALYLVTGDAQEAEELMQDAFLAVWERWDRVGVDGRADRVPVPDGDEPVPVSAPPGASRAARRAVGVSEGEDAFAAADERDAVARALAQLPERQRAAIVLTELLGYGSEEA